MLLLLAMAVAGVVARVALGLMAVQMVVMAVLLHLAQ
jgi:hypothetical protein